MNWNGGAAILVFPSTGIERDFRQFSSLDHLMFREPFKLVLPDHAVPVVPGLDPGTLPS